MVMRDLFTPDPAPMLPLEFPQVELEGRIRRLRSPRYVDYDAGNAILGRLERISFSLVHSRMI